MKIEISTVMIIAFFVTISVLLCVNVNNNFYPQSMEDERLYYDLVTNNWNVEGLENAYNGGETKPVSFLVIWKVVDGSRVWTRAINFIIVLFNTYLLFLITKNKLSFLYPLIIAFLNSMWLTAEIIEVMFLLLAFKYQEKQGWFVGLAATFRPYSAVFILLLQNNKHRLCSLSVGAAFSVILIYYGLFIPYANKMLRYGVTEQYYIENDYVALFMMIPLMVSCFHNNKLFLWGVFACIPLLVSMYGHYFITPYTLFFLGYLLVNSQEKTQISSKQNS